jgi:hypothetical protein
MTCKQYQQATNYSSHTWWKLKIFAIVYCLVQAIKVLIPPPPNSMLPLWWIHAFNKNCCVHILIEKDGDTKGYVNKEIVDELKIISSWNAYHLHLSPFIVLHCVQETRRLKREHGRRPPQPKIDPTQQIRWGGSDIRPLITHLCGIAAAG